MQILNSANGRSTDDKKEDLNCCQMAVQRCAHSADVLAGGSQKHRCLITLTRSQIDYVILIRSDRFPAMPQRTSSNPEIGIYTGGMLNHCSHYFERAQEFIYIYLEKVLSSISHSHQFSTRTRNRR